jgi:hypothetical protein
MADTYKVLGQSFPNGGILTDLYIVPGVKSTIISSIIFCNQNSQQALVRVSIAVVGAVDARKQYIYWDLPLAANDTFIATIGITLGKTDEVRVQSDLGFVSFNLFGAEVL